jgi:hypothetical protein
MQTMRQLKAHLFSGACGVGALCVGTAALSEDTPEIAKQAQNPIASVISLPFQNSTTFGVGPDSRVQDSLLIEPVIPFKLSPDWNLITPTIIPVIEQPTLAPGLGNVSWLGQCATVVVPVAWWRLFSLRSPSQPH